MPAVSRATHGVPAAHAVDAVLVAAVRFPSTVPADVSAVPVSLPAQPTGQVRVELLCPSASNAGAAAVPARVVAATASLVTPHPVASAVQVALVRERAPRPTWPVVSVPPVVTAVQPACRQVAPASDSASVAGAFSTGFAARAAASTAAFRAASAAFAASAARALFSAVAPGAAAVRAASSATC
ncbi:hypothetical protein BJF90_06305 [Pseudonocardia sp. CNS-004]|nr:hypothetical protein BJF90_06305 [Pseudonocardia sp. CNS-004]